MVFQVYIIEKIRLLGNIYFSLQSNKKALFKQLNHKYRFLDPNLNKLQFIIQVYNYLIVDIVI